jgi:ribonuclease VapC
MADGPEDKVVLDASAVLAVLLRERGAEVVSSAAPGAIVSAVTITEISTKLVRLGLPFVEARAVLESGFPCRVVPFDAEQAFIATSLWPQSRANNLSLGDRACLALAIFKRLPVLTADSKWDRVTLPIQVRQIRERNG